MKYDVYGIDHGEAILLKTNCTLQAIIPKGHALSDDEVRQYFGIDEDNEHWERAHRPYNRVDRIVFDKIIIPMSPSYSYVVSTEGD